MRRGSFLPVVRPAARPSPSPSPSPSIPPSAATPPVAVESHADIMDETIRAAKVRRTAATTAEETQNETLLPVSREYIPSPQSSTPSSSGSPNLACELRVGDYVGSPATTTSPATIGVSSSTDVTCDVGDNENDQTEQAAIAKATKNFRSQCWKEFEPILEDGVVVQARCKHCDELMGARRGQGTSALLTHLKRCKKHSKALKIVQDLSSTLRSPCGSRLKDWSYDPDVSRYELM